MKRPISLALLFLAAFALAACGDKHSKDDEHGHEHEEGDHAHEQGGPAHKDDDHAGEHDHGERIDVGSATAGDLTVKLAVFGKVEAGREAVLDIDVKGGAAVAVRAWIGVESAKGSLKAKIDGEGGAYHGHLEVPATLPQGSRIWVEIELEDGSRNATSFAIPQ